MLSRGSIATAFRSVLDEEEAVDGRWGKRVPSAISVAAQ
jgi:hypothetical protein